MAGFAASFEETYPHLGICREKRGDSSIPVSYQAIEAP
jgi:hypothetical protein